MNDSVQLDISLSQHRNDRASSGSRHEGVSAPPAKWKWKSMREVCKVNPSKKELRGVYNQMEVTFVPMSAVDEVEGTIEKATTKLLTEVNKGYTYFREGDVLFAKITPCMENGKSAIARNLVNGIGFGSTEFHVLRPSNEVLAEWIFHFIRQKSFRELAAKYMTGSVGQQRVPDEFIESVEVPVPTLQEQEALVDRMEEVLSKIHRASELREAALNNTEGIMQSALRKLLSAAEEKEWREIELGDVTELVTSGATPTVSDSTLYSDEKNGVPFFRIQNVGENKLILTDLKYISTEVHDTLLKRSQVRPGDVLLTITGRLGTASYLPYNVPIANINQHICLIRLNKTLADPKYIAYHLNSKMSHDEMMQKQAGATRIALNHRTIRSLTIRLPPMPEQRHVVAYLDSLSEKIGTVMRNQSETNDEFENLLETVLNMAFSGQL